MTSDERPRVAATENARGDVENEPISESSLEKASVNLPTTFDEEPADPPGAEPF